MYDPLLTQAVLKRPPLRIGLLVDSRTTLTRVLRTVVEQIRKSNFATIELVVVNESAPPEVLAPSSALTRIRRLLTSASYRSALVWGLYNRWDQRNEDPDTDPNASVSCEDILAGIPVLGVTPITKRFVHRFPPETVEQIRQYRLDVIFRFGFNILRGDILKTAQHGIWSFHHGDNDYYRGGPSHFWEMVEGNPLSGVILQVLTEQLDAGHVLAKGTFATEPGFSLVRNRVQPYWGSVTFAIQKLRELYDHGPEELARRSIPSAPYQGARAIYVAPTSGEMIRWLVPALTAKAFRRLTRGPVLDHWRLAIRDGGPPLRETVRPPDVSGFRPVDSPHGRFYADPFLFNHQGQPWVFFEDYCYQSAIGRISAAPVSPGAAPALGPVVPVLERPYHFSYPCLLAADGELFMIPESMANNSVDLYRCRQFPDRWEFVRCLFQGPAVDTTVFWHGDRYWFFTTLMEERGYAVQLWLFHSARIDGPWTSHAQNPLSTDVRHSRCAGAIVRQNGRIYRPSQDSSGRYGRSFRLNEITRLDPDHYEESPCAPIEPAGDPAWVGTHTYSSEGGLEVIDMCTLMPKRSVA